MRLCWLLFCLCWGQSVIAADDELALYTEHFPPYSYEVDGQARGINVALVQRACEIAEVQCRIQFFPWLRSMEQALRDPQGGIFSIVRTQKRAPRFHWIGPLASSRSYLYRLKRRPEVNPQTLEQAKKFGIAVAHGDIYQELLLEQGFIPGVNLLDFPSKSAPIELFLKGRVDLVIGSDIVMPAWLAPHKANMDQVEVVLELSNLGNNFLALNPKVAPDVRNRLQQALDQMRASGEWQQLIDRNRLAASHQRVPN